MVEATKTPEMTKRAKWEKIKRELLKAHKIFPEIMLIAFDYKSENIQIIIEPVSTQYELKMYDIARKLRYKYAIELENFYIYNLSDFKTISPKNLINPGYKVIYER